MATDFDQLAKWRFWPALGRSIKTDFMLFFVMFLHFILFFHFVFRVVLAESRVRSMTSHGSWIHLRGLNLWISFHAYFRIHTKCESRQIGPRILTHPKYLFMVVGNILICVCTIFLPSKSFIFVLLIDLTNLVSSGYRAFRGLDLCYFWSILY